MLFLIVNRYCTNICIALVFIKCICISYRKTCVYYIFETTDTTASPVHLFTGHLSFLPLLSSTPAMYFLTSHDLFFTTTTCFIVLIKLFSSLFLHDSGVPLLFYYLLHSDFSFPCMFHLLFYTFLLHYEFFLKFSFMWLLFIS